MPGARNDMSWPLIIALVGAFTWGAWLVAVGPLESGAVYPPYSSLRADPVGAKALFESLSEMPGLTVSRLYKTPRPIDADTSLFILGVDPFALSSVPKSSLAEYSKLLQNRGRVVICFLPVYPPNVRAESESKPGALEEEWHIRPQYRRKSANGKQEGEFPRISALYFQPGPEWRVLKSVEGVAKAVERNLERGTLVLLADSFPLSNEGLMERDDSDLIARLVGSAHRVIFDENELGVVESGSVAILFRKYHLVPAVAMLLIVACLFIWRNASSFLPPRQNKHEQFITGRDSHEGLVGLLRRSIPESRLLATCYQEWLRTKPPDYRDKLVAAAMEQCSSGSAAEQYRAASRALMERK